jgi:cytochrome c-type biogenesis protein CcmH/NrfG
MAIPTSRTGFVKIIEDLLAKFLSTDKSNEGQGLTRTDILINKQNWEALLDSYRERTQSEPHNAIAWFKLGDAYNRLNRYEDAILPLYKSTSIDPKNADAWFSLGSAYNQLNRYDDATDALHKSVRIDPKNIFAWRTLGSAYIQLKRYSSAILALHKSILVEPKDAAAWYLLGNAYVLSGNHAAALEAARELRRLDTSRADHLFNLIEKGSAH